MIATIGEWIKRKKEPGCPAPFSCKAHSFGRVISRNEKLEVVSSEDGLSYFGPGVKVQFYCTCMVDGEKIHTKPWLDSEYELISEEEASQLQKQHHQCKGNLNDEKIEKVEEIDRGEISRSKDN